MTLKKYMVNSSFSSTAELTKKYGDLTEYAQQDPYSSQDDETKETCSNEQPDEKTEGLQMKRQVGLFSGVAMVVGIMIGSGIFVSPGNLLQRTQSPALCLLIWIVCGIYSLFGALCYAEIGTLIPKSGGEYIYFLEAFGPTHPFFGPIPAFLYSWVTVFLLKPSSLAVLSLSFAKYLISPIFSAIGYCADANWSYIVARLVAALCICIITFVNCYSVTLATRVQNVFTIGKLTAMIIIIIGGLYNLSIGSTRYLDLGFTGSTTSFSEISQAFYSGLWAYDGWNNLNYITEELQNPHRNLPLAIIIALPVTISCYTLVNVAYFTILSPQEIIASGAVAVDWGNRVLGVFSFIIPLGVVTSVFGTCNASVFSAGRISHVAGREGHSLDLFSFVHITKRTPVVPMLLNAFLALLMIIPGDIGSLIDFFGFTSAIFYGSAMGVLLIMRRTRRNDIRPIKVPIVLPIIFIIVSAYLIIGPIVANPQVQYLYALLIILAGLIFYVPFIYFRKKMPGMDGVTIFLQKFLLIAPTH